MCKECGCGLGGEVEIDGQPGPKPTSALPGESAHPGPDHSHGPDHGPDHGQDHGHKTVAIAQAILDKNERQAERNRGFFLAKKLLVLNVLSSPGSGKTTLIQKTAEALSRSLRLGVIVGDLATDNDAARLRSAGLPVVQITTGTVCHLEAEMVARAMTKLPLDNLDVLVIENVGTLVCRASYDLGEQLRVVLLSVTEGEDKPLKYPPMFHSAHVALITKSDLAQACEFDRAKALANLHRISHHARLFELSARTGQGMDDWIAFLLQECRKLQG
jgi:hydrogenase nickel incorporation protein HypB